MTELIPFQWSYKNGEEIYLVQTKTSEELAFAIQEIKSKFLFPQKVNTPNTQEDIPQPKEVPSVICKICGSKAIIKEAVSKAGNPYKIFKCLAEPELTDKGGHSHFMK